MLSFTGEETQGSLKRKLSRVCPKMRGREAGNFLSQEKNQHIFTRSKAHRPSAPAGIQLKYRKSNILRVLAGLTEVKVGWPKAGMGVEEAKRMKPKGRSELSSGDWVLERSPGWGAWADTAVGPLRGQFGGGSGGVTDGIGAKGPPFAAPETHGRLKGRGGCSGGPGGGRWLAGWGQGLRRRPSPNAGSEGTPRLRGATSRGPPTDQAGCRSEHVAALEGSVPGP